MNIRAFAKGLECCGWWLLFFSSENQSDFSVRRTRVIFPSAGDSCSSIAGNVSANDRKIRESLSSAKAELMPCAATGQWLTGRKSLLLFLKKPSCPAGLILRRRR
ncbi:MAG: hypothetical protein D3917_19175 [Candidatus Electrothrix sp. AX5]|nr:hypothetical protein [Candidatus Electrothrix sp. AX5]